MLLLHKQIILHYQYNPDFYNKILINPNCPYNKKFWVDLLIFLMYIKSLKLSKVSYFLSLLVMIMFSSKVIAAEEDLSFPFNADSGKYWQYVSDRVMGGVSDGQVTLEQD